MPYRTEDETITLEHVKNLLALAELIGSVLTPEERRRIREQRANW
jgi:hypothetical protein